ncbi:ATP-binding cassette domain-containing protein [Herbaspirillum seropedicae]|uniref:ABC-type bacteriocin/lantibiotic ATPase/permease fusion exporter protein n=1 Tax=Herbaspirillum seropedicae (strain SmR1) TaxID=757424 RepID=D8IRJ2_HERSS|nr:ATP-binding cassette domain-containing protein [Herbaspirillum seropedicae]ADJ63316.1 ABC-type bacteriocin/lantibiotic ATPase/permease fusion exporter protein [Herbaspirillum seropedicae SmR1]AKN65354.1 bacteriocin ABC transporter permease [Herbaspirillum seropedicae]AON54136.1 ABC-type bacteriocin/lantibiotic ATPase/permease fusion exporter protein [Herbaspirillum seropedicae]NQE31591.1 bacteriocin ABC transporter permease [Herbaspirillum seropedicae]QDD64235.1 ATP-binding cassette domain-
MNASEQVHIDQPQVLQDLRADPSYLSLLRAYGSRFVEIIVAGIVVNVLGLLMPLYSRLIYDKVIGNHIPETLWALTLGMLLFVALELVLRIIRVYYTEQLAGRLDSEFDEVSARRMLTARVQAPVGVVLARYRDLSAARDLMSSNYMLLLVDLPFLLLYLVVLGLIGGHMVWVLLVGGGLLVGLQLLLKVPGNDYANSAMKAGTGKVDKLASIVYGMETLKTSPLQHRLLRAFLADASANAVAQAKSRFWMNTSYAISSVGYTLISVATLVVGVYLVEDNLLTVGALIACSLLISRAATVLSSLAAFLGRIEMFRRARAEFDQLFEEPEQGPTADVLRQDMRGLIQVGNLLLHLDKKETPTLRNISLTIQPGEKVGIVGRSGSGKSTLLRTLAGLHQAEEGHVLIDGVAVTAYAEEVRMRCIGFKPQEPFLFDGTVAANIFVGDRVPGQVYEAALAVSSLDDLIARGELRLDQLIKAPGNLSGGQRQMVALARVIACTPRILLLDEPTTGIDQQTEARIIERLVGYAGGRTLVVATHSPALLRHMDRIVVIDGGRIVADGPRAQILQ